jgi:trimeric autotransporter adhesin
MKKITSLLMILICGLTMVAYGQSWNSVGSGSSMPVQSMSADQSKNVLYSGGLLGISQWDGSSWSPLGLISGLGVTSMTSQNGDLIVGGNFTSIGGILANNVARWDGANWLPLGVGLSYTGATTVSTLCVYNGELYAGGTFLTPGFSLGSGLSLISYIAKWNGSQWKTVGTGVNGVVKSLCVYNGQLYVGGTFTKAGSVAVNNIAKWNGSSWSAVGGGLKYTGGTTVSTLCVFAGDLYAGGTFTTAGTTPVNNIAKWDGSSWSDVGGGVSYTGATTVSTLCVYGGGLIAGGTFDKAGANPASFIGRWSGSGWSALGTGTNNSVLSLATLGNILYAGGNFLTAGGISTPHIAQWGSTSPQSGYAASRNAGNNNIAADNAEENFVIYPNPAENRLWIKQSKPLFGTVTISIIDILGREVLKSAVSNDNYLERGSLPSGIYVYKITHEDGSIVQEGIVTFK